MAYFKKDPMPLGTIPGGIYDLPRNPDKFCNKFYYLGARTVDEHIEAFKDVVVCNNIEHQDVVCRIFPYSLGKNEYNWYLTLPTNSITSLDVLEKAFIDQFQVYVDPGTLYHQFASLKKSPNEPLTTFNTSFQRAYKRL